MPYCDNEGVSIYYEVKGKGPSVVLSHQLGASPERWCQAGYVEAMTDDYQLILVDARGHGASDKPNDPEAYRLKLMAADVVAVLDDLKVRTAHFLGYSMGGWIGWGIAKYAPERFRSLLIGGASPPCESDEPNSAPDLFRKGMDAVLEALREMYRERLTPEIQAIWQSNDLDALIALTSGEDWRGLPGFEKLLPTVTLPCLINAGEASDEHASAQEYAKSMPNATFVSLPNLDHVDAFARQDLMRPHITRFLAEVSQI